MRVKLVAIGLIVLMVLLGVFLYVFSLKIVTISSEIKGIKVSISDRKLLDSLLKDSGFWETKKWNKEGNSSVRVFNIVLTDKPQPLYIILNGDKTSSSYNVEYKSNFLKLTVQVDPTVISKEDIPWEIEKKIIKLVSGLYPGISSNLGIETAEFITVESNLIETYYSYPRFIKVVENEK